MYKSIDNIYLWNAPNACMDANDTCSSCAKLNKVNLAFSEYLSSKQWEEILVRFQEYHLILHWMITRKSDYGPPIYGISGVRKKKNQTERQGGTNKISMEENFERV